MFERSWSNLKDLVIVSARASVVNLGDK
jgi:hypothetical protein